MNAYLLLSGILAAIGLYIIWTRRIDEGGGSGVHLLVAAALIILIAAGKYLTTFSSSQQITALVIGLSGILIYQHQKRFLSRRAPSGFNQTSTVVLTMIVAVSLFFSVQTEMSLYDGFPLVSLIMSVALLALFSLKKQEQRKSTDTIALKETESGK
jgi:NADH:ubiquinone oxidoreductase subunit K